MLIHCKFLSKELHSVLFLDENVSFRVMYLGDTSVGIQLVDNREQFTSYYLTYKQMGKAPNYLLLPPTRNPIETD